MGLDFNDFLQLMVQQLQNQTMDNTTDTGEMLNQLVQMSTVQMLSSVKTGLENLVDASTLTYAASLVGKTVTVGQYDEDGKLQEIEGVVTGTGNYQGVPVIFVNDEMYPLNSIMAVGKLPEIPEEPEGPGEGGGDGTGEGGENPPEESTPEYLSGRQEPPKGGIVRNGACGRGPRQPRAGTGPYVRRRKPSSSGFGAVLQQELARAEERQIAFSKHAIARAEERGIAVTPALLDRLTDSVERAQAKGATNILALDQSLAFIINVPHNRVITTLSQDEMKENIFTNIDGAVIL